MSDGERNMTDEERLSATELEADAQAEEAREDVAVDGGEGEAVSELIAGEGAAPIEALNEDGTAVDQYDAESLAHVGSESVAEDVVAATVDNIDETVAEVEEELAADTLEEGEEGNAPEEPEENVPQSAPEEEEVEEVEEAEEEAAPTEPDPPEEQTGPQDPEGIVTTLSTEAFEKLTEIWQSRGSPHQFDFQGNRWTAYDRGEKFVRTGGPAGMEEFYNSLSIG